ncbi:MAG: transglutaminase-like domain-containing protein, partial [Lachnospiraceae bacterium]|nr:transglutaminase-like domain-containing protein [Lachnospiraceae bacterium]
VYAEWIRREWKKAGNSDRKKYMMCIMPFVALYFFLMLLMPTPAHPYEWRFVKETCSRLRDSFMSLTQNLIEGGGEDFDTALSGFSEEGELREEIEENDREVMTLRSDRNLETNVYLTGRIYDTFDGRSWRQENHDTEGRIFQDAAWLQNAALQLESDYLRNYFTAATLQVRYKYLRTACLFTPLKTRQIRVHGENNPYFQDGDNLLFRKRKGYGTEYETDYYQINVGADRFDELVRDACGADVNEEQARRIYEIYGEDIVFSEETEQYLEGFAGSAQDRLDWLRLVEQELSSYTYTRQPGELPEDAADAGTFLDYFLLEGREGYCTHFATAFVLLARSQGMSARYVQGFCVPMKGVNEVSVYSNMAHAWPEVYFEGVGWVPFEPTPGFGGLRYTPWETEQREGETEGRLEESTGRSAEREEGIRANVPDEAEEAGGNRNGAGWFLRAAGYALLAVCVTGFLFLMIQRIFRQRHYRRMDVTGRFRAVVSVNMRILAMLGFRRDSRETLQEFRERITHGTGCADCRLRFIEDYEEILYGEKEAGQEMLQAAMEERRELMKTLKEKKGWRYFLFYYCRVCIL